MAQHRVEDREDGDRGDEDGGVDGGGVTEADQEKGLVQHHPEEPKHPEPAQVLPVGYPPPSPEQVDEEEDPSRSDDAEENDGCRREVPEHDLADDRQAGEQDLN